MVDDKDIGLSSVMVLFTSVDFLLLFRCCSLLFTSVRFCSLLFVNSNDFSAAEALYNLWALAQYCIFAHAHKSAA